MQGFSGFQMFYFDQTSVIKVQISALRCAGCLFLSLKKETAFDG